MTQAFYGPNTDLIDNIRSVVLSILNSRSTELPDAWLYAQFSAAESSDADLSIITLPDLTTLRGVPKNSAVGSLTEGDVVLLAIPRSGPACIICRVIGNFANFTL